MAIKKNGHPHQHYAGGKEHADAAELSARLAPPEEKAGAGGAAAAPASQSKNNGGAIIVDTGSLKFPKDFVDPSKETSSMFRPEPVLLVILILALAFIAFIAWQISLMEP